MEAVDEIVAEETKFPRSQGNGIDDGNENNKRDQIFDKSLSIIKKTR